VTYAIDPELAAAIPMMPVVDIYDLADIPKVRAHVAKSLAAFDLPERTGVQVSEERVVGPAGVPEVRLRVYRPQQAAGPAGVYHVHGGGFILGDLEGDHIRNVELCHELGAVVVSVDYRLAPEHPFPAGLEDCYAALSWMAANAAELGIDPARIAIHGMSAGAGLCAALALLARDRHGPEICFQYLGVPEVDDRLETPSMQAFVDTPVVKRPNVAFGWDAYLGAGVRGTEGVSHYAAPARATELGGLPSAYVSVMQFDPLRDEGIAYALALLAAGVSVELHLFPGTYHASSLVQSASVSRRELAEEVAVLRRALQL
jgi:acetyl esterase